MAVRWSANARADFLHAVEVSLETFGRVAAERLIDRVERRLANVTMFPELGQLLPDDELGQRVVRAGLFRIVYRIEDDDVVVVAFLHGARDSLLD